MGAGGAGVEVSPAPVVRDRWVTYDGVRGDDPRFEGALRVVREEMGKHSSAFISGIGLKGVWLAGNVAVAGQRRAAVVLQGRGVVVVDVGTPVEGTYLRHAVQHELYHLAELTTAGRFYFKDPKWAALNPAGVTYGNGGRWEQDGRTRPGRLDHPEAGFVNRYAMSGLEEDKAEVFACLFVPGEREMVEAWAREDEALAGKVRRMKEFVAWWEGKRDGRVVDLMGAIARDEAGRVGELVAVDPRLARAEAWGGWRPLQWAAAHAANRVIPVLVKYVGVGEADGEGWTAVRVAEAVGDRVTVRQLENLGATR